MKLGDVFQATSAWNNLGTMKMRPRMAYLVLKYIQALSAEQEVIEKQRVALIHELTNTKEGENAKIEPGTLEFRQYAERFNDILATQCDVQPFEYSLDQVVEGLDEDEGNSLSAQDLAFLEPFFSTEQKEEEVAVAGRIQPAA